MCTQQASHTTRGAITKPGVYKQPPALLFFLSSARKPGQHHFSHYGPLIPLKRPFTWSGKLWRVLVTIPTILFQLFTNEQQEAKKVKMRELFPATQTAGKYQELPCEQTRWAAIWVWWTASSWPALKLLHIHPPQLERPPEDAAHLFNSCLGWVLTFSDKEPAPKRPRGFVSSLHWTPFTAEPKPKKR